MTIPFVIVGVALVVAWVLFAWWTLPVSSDANARKARTFFCVLTGMMIGCLAFYIAFISAVTS